jgi:hypothetical protein
MCRPGSILVPLRGGTRGARHGRADGLRGRQSRGTTSPAEAAADNAVTAEVIVTMGHSVVDIALPTCHEDWRVGDPIGAPVDEIRRAGNDIQYRVRALLRDLGTTTAH